MDTRLVKFAVDTRLVKFAVDTRLVKFAVLINPPGSLAVTALDRYPAVPRPATVDAICVVK